MRAQHQAQAHTPLLRFLIRKLVGVHMCACSACGDARVHFARTHIRRINEQMSGKFK